MSDHGQAALGLGTQLDRHVPLTHTTHTSPFSSSKYYSQARQIPGGRWGWRWVRARRPEPENRREVAAMLEGGFVGVPSAPKPEMSRTGGLPASYWGSGALLGEFHQGFSPWVPLRCPSGALVDDLHPGMNFILADGFRASFVPPVARCPLRNSFSLTAPRPSLTYSSSRLQ